MSKSRIPVMLGLAGAGGVGYYLYQSGGNTKVAQKQFEHDMHSASTKVKSELPGRGREYEKEAEKLGAQAGAKFDTATANAKAEAAKLEAYARDAKAGAMKKVDEFDRKVEDGAAKAKGGISGWFGGK
ncbi:hypothetical protein GGTG_00401 [Gaeumannomyces tritici R3-111a-1]|uniref:Calcofluor white hypersensitive protein n=1 Tax=Gaeumannomyces tritici (strain R3-111a-1) TaxID=644352 RepID=J3NGL1_GAET3|nr:hypothetical protein GGTG_00401 [Gaeumannomyces tritici R3-111a-1]EJT80401.1 hypothetical protein GGTG_00401 [Gaeumannomyces tritici R3-111a-1]